MNAMQLTMRGMAVCGRNFDEGSPLEMHRLDIEDILTKLTEEVDPMVRTALLETLSWKLDRIRSIEEEAIQR